MTVVFAVTLVMLCLAGALTLARLLLGHTTLDRIAAVAVFVILIVAAVAVYVAIYRQGSNIPLLAAVALLGFVGSATAAGSRSVGSGTGEPALRRSPDHRCDVLPARGAGAAALGRHLHALHHHCGIEWAR